MKMKKILACILAMVLLASAVPLAVMPAGAQDTVVPGDKEPYDRIISKDELASVIIPYMLGKEGHLGLDEVREVAHIHVYYPRTITDSADRTVTIYKPIKRIVALTDDSAEALRVLGGKNKVVGASIDVTDEKVFFPDLSEVQCVGKWNEPDYEMILSLSPDLIISYKTATVKYLVPQLGDTDIALVALDFYKEDIMRAEFEKLGYILEKEEYAKRYIDFFSDTRDTIVDRVSDIPEEDRVKVYLEGYSDYKTYVRGKGADVACTAAGGINIAADLEGHYPEVSPEWVLWENPDIIIRLTPPSKIACGYDIDDPSEIIAKRQEVMNRPTWDNTTAVKNGSVYMLLYEFGCSPRVPITIAYMAKWFYPDKFKDLDPKAIHQEYLTEFSGLDYDLDKHGVFAYPEPS